MFFLWVISSMHSVSGFEGKTVTPAWTVPLSWLKPTCSSHYCFHNPRLSGSTNLFLSNLPFISCPEEAAWLESSPSLAGDAAGGQLPGTSDASAFSSERALATWKGS